MKKIIFIGGFSHKDIGDESMLEMAIHRLRSRIKTKIEFLVLADTPKNIEEYHKIKAIKSLGHYFSRYSKADKYFLFFIYFFSKIAGFIFPQNRNLSTKECACRIFNFLRGYYLVFNAYLFKILRFTLLDGSIKRILQEIKSSDLLFNVGGANLNSYHFHAGLLSKGFTYYLFKIYRKPVIVSGQTIGPFSSYLDEWMARKLLNIPLLLTVRDVDDSLKLLKKLGINKPTIVETGDDSLFLPVSGDKRIFSILEKENIPFDKYSNIYGISVHNWPRVEENLIEMFKEKIVKFCKKRLEDKNTLVIFLPMQVHPSADDRKIEADILTEINSDSCVMIKGEHKAGDLKGIISKCHAFIGTRYHSIIFSITSLVPCVAIAWDNYYLRKMRGIMAITGQENYILRLENLLQKEGVIDKCFDSLLTKRNEIRKGTKQRLYNYKYKNQIPMDYAIKAIS